MQPKHASAYALSRTGYYADFFTVPFATMVAVIWMLSLHNFDPKVFASSMIAGFLAWTFVEYSAHRWLLHFVFNVEHRNHHLFPAAFIGASPLVTAIVGAFAFCFLTAAFGPIIGVGLLVGLVIGYLLYIHVHDRIHHGTITEGTYLAALNSNHSFHHRRFGSNFGVTSPAWDYIFGTYQRNPFP